MSAFGAFQSYLLNSFLGFETVGHTKQNIWWHLVVAAPVQYNSTHFCSIVECSRSLFSNFQRTLEAERFGIESVYHNVSWGEASQLNAFENLTEIYHIKKLQVQPQSFFHYSNFDIFNIFCCLWCLIKTIEGKKLECWGYPLVTWATKYLLTGLLRVSPCT